MQTTFDKGLDIAILREPIGFEYGPGVFGPEPELRHLDDIRRSLRNPACAGPAIVYAIAMDVGKESHRAMLEQMNLLFGVVTYAAGRLGCEPVRSQGHVHKISPFSGSSTPEVYEIWSGHAIIYMQETDGDNPGRCFAVHAHTGDVVIVPPYWAHATVSADSQTALTFGAWCDRNYGFVYDGVRRHGGVAWFPVFDGEKLVWERNPAYGPSELIEKTPEDYRALGIDGSKSIYALFEDRPEIFKFVPQPQVFKTIWDNFTP